MDEGSGFALVPIFVIVFLACGAQAVAPVSPPESRFVWEPGANQSFTWTNANFDGFYYDPENGAGNESLTMKYPVGGIVYHTTIRKATTRYRPFGEYAFIGFRGEKCMAGFPAGKSNITNNSGIKLNLLQSILIDEDTSFALIEGGNLALSEGYVLEIRDVNATGSQVALSLRKEGVEVDTKTIDTGKNYVYKIQNRPIIAVHIDPILNENGTVSAAIKGIFQVSEYQTPINEGDTFGDMTVTEVSDTGITMRNTLFHLELKPVEAIEILTGTGMSLKAADLDIPRIHLFNDGKNEHRGSAASNKLAAWDGLNYAGFLYDVDSGNFSESLEITNMTGRRIPEGGLTYTSYIMRVPYAVNKISGKNLSGTDWSYETFSLGGNKYAVKSNGFARIWIAHGDTIYEKKTLTIEPYAIKGETWELGEGYSLAVTSVSLNENPRKARLVLSRNSVELEDVWLSSGNAYKYFSPGETGMPKLVTYLDAVFAGATMDMIVLRYTWFVSNDVNQIKEGDRLGVFNVTVMEPDRMVLKNRVPIELKAGSSINLFGNLSFYVENSDELRFYPTNMAGTQVMTDEVPVNEVPDIPDVATPVETFPVAGRMERIPGFKAVLAITILLAVYKIGRKRR